jgi:hypothetical protein
MSRVLTLGLAVLPGLAVASLIALGIAAPALAHAQAGGNIYGADGSYQGRISRDGNEFGADGSYRGRITRDGNIFGPDGSYQGRISGFDDASRDSARRSRRPPP